MYVPHEVRREKDTYSIFYIYCFCRKINFFFVCLGRGKQNTTTAGCGDGDVNCTTLFTRQSSLYTDVFRRISINERLELQRRHQLGSVQARFKNSIPEKQKRVNY